MEIYLYYYFKNMGFWKDTIRAFAQTKERKIKLDEFIKNKKLKFYTELKNTITQYSERCNSILSDLQINAQKQLEEDKKMYLL